MNKQEKSQYIILPGTKEYDEMLIGMHNLGLTEDIKAVGKRLGLELQNTGKELDGTPFIGNINRNQALELVLSLENSFVPTITQYIDELVLLNSGKEVYDGNGKRISSLKVKQLFDNDTKLGDYRGRWLDDYFIKVNNIMCKVYNHRLRGEEIVFENIEILNRYPNSHYADKYPYDCYADLNSFDRQGVPITKSKDQEYIKGKNLRFHGPRNNSVARFGADSGWAILICGWVPTDAFAGLGVRVAKKLRR